MPKASRIKAFLEGASYAFDPYATVNVPRLKRRDPRDDAARLRDDARVVLSDLACAIDLVMPRGA